MATITALIVCSRLSAWSNTIEAGDSKTSSVTSSAVSLRVLYSRRPVSVSRLCRAGRQCMNFTAGFPVAAITSRFTW